MSITKFSEPVTMSSNVRFCLTQTEMLINFHFTTTIYWWSLLLNWSNNCCSFVSNEVMTSSIFNFSPGNPVNWLRPRTAYLLSIYTFPVALHGLLPNKDKNAVKGLWSCNATKQQKGKLKECKVIFYFRHKTGPKTEEGSDRSTGRYSSLEDANEDFSPAGDVTLTQNLYIKIQHDTEPAHTKKTQTNCLLRTDPLSHIVKNGCAFYCVGPLPLTSLCARAC